ncbi:hypothetical protein AB6E26_25945 [Vibrio splendidus]
MKVYRRVKQTKYVMAGKDGLLAIHDAGSIAASKDHKPLLRGFESLCEVFSNAVDMKYMLSIWIVLHWNQMKCGKSFKVPAKRND